MKNVRSSD